MKATIIYYSATGNTEAIAQQLELTLIDLNYSVNLLEVENADILDCEADLVLLGSPAMGVEEIEEYEFRPFFEDALEILKDRNVILFGSYDWGDGEWIETWKEECEEVGVHVLTSIKVMLDPNNEDLNMIDTELRNTLQL